MDNQHRYIKGYRELGVEEIDQMNAVKELAALAGNFIKEMEKAPGLDQRWVAEAKMDLQKGFMAMARAIAQPTSF